MKHTIITYTKVRAPSVPTSGSRRVGSPYADPILGIVPELFVPARAGQPLQHNDIYTEQGFGNNMDAPTATILAGSIGAGGALLGALLQSDIARRNQRATETAMEQRIAFERSQDARRLAAAAYANASASVQWLHDDHVEDTVDPGTRDRFLPQYEVEIERLRRARSDLDQVAALLAGSSLSETAGRVARLLTELDGRWQRARSWMSLSERAGPRIIVQDLLNEAVASLRSIRTELTGWVELGSDEEARTPIGGLLGQLREAVGSA